MAKMHYEFITRFDIKTIDSDGKRVLTDLHNKFEYYEVLGNGVDIVNTIWKNLEIEPQIQLNIDLDKLVKLDVNHGPAFIYVNSELDFDKIRDLLNELIENLNPCIIRTYQYNSRKFTDYFRIGIEPICIYCESVEQWQKEQEKSINCNENYLNYCWN